MTAPASAPRHRAARRACVLALAALPSVQAQASGAVRNRVMTRRPDDGRNDTARVASLQATLATTESGATLAGVVSGGN